MNIPRLIWEKSRSLTEVLHCFSAIRQKLFVKSGKRYHGLSYLYRTVIDRFGDSIAGMQTLGASGACHMGATFLKHHYWPNGKRGTQTVYIPAETWGMNQVSYHPVPLRTDLT